MSTADVKSAIAAAHARGHTPRRSSLALLRERAVEIALVLAAVSSVLVTCGIVMVLVGEAIPFFRDVSVIKFLTGTVWTPLFAEPEFGILPLVSGTLMTTLVALGVAMPVGTIIAIWLSEFASHRVREIVKPILEVLSAVPTVVFGYFAINLVSPLLQRVLPDLPTFNMLSAGMVMGIMIVPYVSSLSEDAMRSVPMLLREGSFAMGAGKLTTAIRVVFPAALSGIGAAYTLAVARAVGETMIVAIAAGQQPNFTLNPLNPAATITAYIVQVSLGDLPHDSVGYRSIFAAGLTLFVVTLGFNIVGLYLRRRFRQEY